MKARRLLFLDTETTGLEPVEEHRVIEIGCLEMLDRALTGRQRRWLLNPQRALSRDAVEVHGIDDAQLQGQPLFADIAAELIEFVRGGTLVMHNAPFDLGFLNAELERAGYRQTLESGCDGVLDTLPMARAMHPGQRNSLDALCRRYHVDHSAREAGHGALLDARLLAEVYLAMTSGQIGIALQGDTADGADAHHPGTNRKWDGPCPPLLVIEPTPEEEREHEQQLRAMERLRDKSPDWG